MSDFPENFKFWAKNLKLRFIWKQALRHPILCSNSVWMADIRDWLNERKTARNYPPCWLFVHACQTLRTTHPVVALPRRRQTMETVVWSSWNDWVNWMAVILTSRALRAFQHCISSLMVRVVPSFFFAGNDTIFNPPKSFHFHFCKKLVQKPQL